MTRQSLIQHQVIADALLSSADDTRRLRLSDMKQQFSGESKLKSCSSDDLTDQLEA